MYHGLRTSDNNSNSNIILKDSNQHCITATKTNRLTPLTENVAVYCENHKGVQRPTGTRTVWGECSSLLLQ
jgi:hypothetical protein